MTPEQQRIAIAAQLPSHLYDEQGRWMSPYGWLPFDPLKDLNAAHAAERMLGQKRGEYIHNLIEIVKRGPATIFGHNPVHATAAERAEAFLRAIGKWDDSK